ncbi:MAG: hypothetical protein QM775_05285 [Pirellulales bacterium]
MSTTVSCVDWAGNSLESEPLSLPVSSPKAKPLIAFYRQLGLTMEPVQTEKSGYQSIIGRCPGFNAKFIGGPPASREPSAPLCFVVADVRGLVPRLVQAGGKLVSPVREEKPNWRLAVVDAPEGARSP